MVRVNLLDEIRYIIDYVDNGMIRSAEGKWGGFGRGRILRMRYGWDDFGLGFGFFIGKSGGWGRN